MSWMYLSNCKQALNRGIQSRVNRAGLRPPGGRTLSQSTENCNCKPFFKRSKKHRPRTKKKRGREDSKNTDPVAFTTTKSYARSIYIVMESLHPALVVLPCKKTVNRLFSSMRGKCWQRPCHPKEKPCRQLTQR
jgi:hypothetical protein